MIAGSVSLAFTFLAALAATQGAWAASELPPAIVIQHQSFQPDSLTIPAGKKVRIQVTNKDTVPAEFESDDFSCEKVIPGGTQVPVYVGPLKPGRYGFFNDFHPSSKGNLIVKRSQ